MTVGYGYRRLAAILILAAAAAAAASATDPETPETLTMDDESAGFAAAMAALALDCVHREYPNQISLALNADSGLAPPRDLHPAFYGCYDWHSAVHGHWLLVRLLRRHPDADFAAAARTALAGSLTAANIRGEIDYFDGPGRQGFERPYGLAWLLQLDAELRTWDDADARQWAEALAPLAEVAAQRFLNWLPNLLYPVRSGTHSQSAFGFALALDWARIAGQDDLARLLESRAQQFFAGDRDCPLGYEPSGEDFLSPCLMEADLMRRVLAPTDYARWLSGFLPDLPHDGGAGWLRPGAVKDPTDGRLVHLDGVNLSRAWNLEAIAAALPGDDPRRAALAAAAREHRLAGLMSVTGAHYAGGHWLASFATYLVTGKALEATGPGAAARP